MLLRAVIVAFCLSLAGCGFHLRQELRLPAEFADLQVQTPDPYSALQRGLEQAMARAGAKASGSSKSVLRVSKASLEQRPLSVGATGRVQEYQLVYRVEVELIDANGHVRMPKQAVELERAYSFDTAQSLGSPAEEDLIREELERAMVDAILRRVDAVLRG